MKALLDTNIVLDYILKRSPFFKHSKTIIEWAFEQKIIAYISASAVTDIYYLVQRAKDKTTALNFIRDILQFIQIAGVDKDIILVALQSGINDFEDAVQNAAAENAGIKYIITRNVKDFSKSDIQIILPDKFVRILYKQNKH